MTAKLYSGECICSYIWDKGNKKGTKCSRKAYFLQNDLPYCGIHSKKEKRKHLPKNPNIQVLKKANILLLKKKAEEEASKNKKNSKEGDVILTRLGMFKQEQDVTGFRKIFPNYLHGNIDRGEGMPSLSPKSMGPIVHPMKSLPTAKNLENYWQFSKVFPSEVDEEGNPTSEFRKRRIEGFKDPIPHRHKFDLKKMKDEASSGNKNIPLYAVFSNEKGEERRYNYIEGRWFYCTEFENFALKDPNFKKLQKWKKEGYNLQIVGYDAYDIGSRDIYDIYKDNSVPFGHERVLYCLLTIDKKEDYPWNKYFKDNRHLYF